MDLKEVIEEENNGFTRDDNSNDSKIESISQKKSKPKKSRKKKQKKKKQQLKQ